MASRMEPGQVPISPRAVATSHAYVGLTLSLLFVSSLLFTTRLYARIKPVLSLGMDDWIATVAFILATTDAILAIVANYWALGKSPDHIAVSTLSLITTTALAVSIIGAWAVASVKISVAFLFLRLKRAGVWTTFLYTMIAVQIITAVFVTIMQSTRYIPFEAGYSPNMELRKSAQVWSDQAFGIGITVSSTSNVVTDIIFSLMPVAIIRDIQRPRREKVIVGILMGLGLVASSASIAKTVAVHNLGKTDDILAEGTKVGLFSILEEQLGIIVACVPCLRALMQRVLRKHGLFSTNTYFNKNTGRSQHRSNNVFTHRDEDTESQKEIVVVSEVHVEHEHSHRVSSVDIELDRLGNSTKTC